MPNHNKLYLSMSQTRRLSAEMPVGDPFGGVAYGERNPPAIAIVGAAMSVATGVGMVAAGMAATGVMATLTTIAGGLMVAGGVLSGVGVLTRNEKLQKIGGVMSLVGGVGGLAMSVGTALSQPGATLGSALKAGAGQMGKYTSDGFGKITSSVQGFFGGEAASSVNTAPATTSNIAGSATPGTQNTMTADFGIAPSQNAPGMDVLNQGIKTPTDFTSAIAPTPDAAGASTTGIGSETSVPGVFKDTKTLEQLRKTGGGDSGGSLLSGANQWMKDNPLMAYSAMQGVSSMFAPDPNEAQMKMYNQQVARANDYPVIINPNNPTAFQEAQNAKNAGKQFVWAGYQAPSKPAQPMAQPARTGLLNQKTRTA